jgi:hypothetical protein
MEMKRIERLGATSICCMGAGEDGEERMLLRSMHREARDYMTSISWCQEIKSTYFRMRIGKIVAVFLFEVDPIDLPEEDLIWVIVGDLPPACLVTLDGAQLPSEALEIYIELMNEWVTAVKCGKSVKDLIPVNVPPVRDYAEQLEGGLEFLKENVLRY